MIVSILILILFIVSIAFMFKASERVEDKQVKIILTIVGVILIFSLYLLSRVGFI